MRGDVLLLSHHVTCLPEATVDTIVLISISDFLYKFAFREQNPARELLPNGDVVLEPDAALHAADRHNHNRKHVRSSLVWIRREQVSETCVSKKSWTISLIAFFSLSHLEISSIEDTDMSQMFSNNT